VTNDSGYLLDNRQAEAGTRFDALPMLFNPSTFRHIDALSSKGSLYRTRGGSGQGDPAGARKCKLVLNAIHSAGCESASGTRPRRGVARGRTRSTTTNAMPTVITAIQSAGAPIPVTNMAAPGSIRATAIQSNGFISAPSLRTCCAGPAGPTRAVCHRTREASAKRLTYRSSAGRARDQRQVSAFADGSVSGITKRSKTLP